MFGKRSKASVSPIAPVLSDRYTLISDGRRVTLLEDLGGGDVRVAMDSGNVCRDWIVNRRDIRPA